MIFSVFFIFFERKTIAEDLQYCEIENFEKHFGIPENLVSFKPDRIFKEQKLRWKERRRVKVRPFYPKFKSDFLLQRCRG